MFRFPKNFLIPQVPRKGANDPSPPRPAGGLLQRNVGRLPVGSPRAAGVQREARQRVPEQMPPGGGGPAGRGHHVTYKRDHQSSGELSAFRESQVAAGDDRGTATFAESGSLERVDDFVEKRRGVRERVGKWQQVVLQEAEGGEHEAVVGCGQQSDAGGDT